MGASLSRVAGWVYGAPEGLPELPDVQELLPCALRILGQNPGPATLQGTNTYLLGTGTGRILVDTSDGNSRWWPILERVLAERGATISDVILTHRHYDHVGGVGAVRDAFPQARVWKGPDSFEEAAPAPADATAGAVPPPTLPPEEEPGAAATDDRCRLRSRRGSKRFFRRGRCQCGSSIPADCRVLEDGQVIAVEGAAVRVLLTPGHSTDSACFVLAKSGGSGKSVAILTGDTVLGGMAGMFDNIKSYRTSLEVLLQELAEELALYPGHGDMTPKQQATTSINSQLFALQNREAAVLRILRETEGGASLDEICGELYGSVMTSQMASHIIQEHLNSLVERGLVRETPGWLLSRTTFEAVEGTSTASLSRRALDVYV